MSEGPIAPAKLAVRDTVTCDGDGIAYATCGDPADPALLLIHGWMGSKQDWRYLLPTLAQTHFCVVPDLLGHGDSDKPAEGDYSIQAQAQRVLAVVDALGIDRFAVCGHSMGGAIALTLAASFAPERVTRVVSLSGVVSRGTPLLTGALALAEHAGFLIDFGFAAARRLAHEPWGQRFLGAGNFYTNVPPDFGTVDLPGVLQPGMEITFHRALEAVLATDLRPALPQIACPVLSITSRNDRLVPPGQGRLAADLIPDHRLACIEASGHYQIVEKPAECLALIGEFLASSEHKKLERFSRGVRAKISLTKAPSPARSAGEGAKERGD